MNARQPPPAPLLHEPTFWHVFLAGAAVGALITATILGSQAPRRHTGAVLRLVPPDPPEVRGAVVDVPTGACD